MSKEKAMKLTNEILDKKCDLVTFDSNEQKTENERLAVKMFSMMTESKGIGLAANQVGINQSIFVTFTDGKYKAYYNPKLLDWSDELITFEEGCLSFPDEYHNIERPKDCKVEWNDHKGNTNRIELTGIEARVWLHEYDHINGIVFQQRLENKNIPEELKYVKT
tara:strand:- start:1547 stop:2038 length:492 start_codon:yes stop_codon:yes gene_type:complete